jgi:hypothetical protein
MFSFFVSFCLLFYSAMRLWLNAKNKKGTGKYSKNKRQSNPFRLMNNANTTVSLRVFVILLLKIRQNGQQWQSGINKQEKDGDDRSCEFPSLNVNFLQCINRTDKNGYTKAE